MKHSEPFIYLLFFILSLFSTHFRTHFELISFFYFTKRLKKTLTKLKTFNLSQSPFPRVEVCDHVIEGLPPPQQPSFLLPDALDIFVDVLVLNRLRPALRRAPLRLTYIFDFELSVSVDLDIQ